MWFKWVVENSSSQIFIFKHENRFTYDGNSSHVYILPIVYCHSNMMHWICFILFGLVCNAIEGALSNHALVCMWVCELVDDNIFFWLHCSLIIVYFLWKTMGKSWWYKNMTATMSFVLAHKNNSVHMFMCAFTTGEIEKKGNHMDTTIIHGQTRQYLSISRKFYFPDKMTYPRHSLEDALRLSNLLAYLR